MIKSEAFTHSEARTLDRLFLTSFKIKITSSFEFLIYLSKCLPVTIDKDSNKAVINIGFVYFKGNITCCVAIPDG